MKGIVIAAGMGSRLMPLTKDKPKCMLPINGKPLLAWTIENMRAFGCDKIIVITGYKDSAIICDDIIRIKNENFSNNNILHSLMCAQDEINEPVIISYSDIWVEPNVYEQLMNSKGDVVASVDTDWEGYYVNRNGHPIEEAENVIYKGNKIIKVGKHIDKNKSLGKCGEFLGLWYMSELGCEMFCNMFQTIDNKLKPDSKFQQAPNWKSSYITDLFQELIDNGYDINCSKIERSWAEIDTLEDYNRLKDIAKSRYLWTLCN